MKTYDALVQVLAESLKCPTSAIRRMKETAWDLRAYRGTMPEQALPETILEAMEAGQEQVFMRISNTVLLEAIEALAQKGRKAIPGDGITEVDHAMRRMASHIESGLCPPLNLMVTEQRLWARELFWATRFNNAELVMRALRRACAAGRAPELLAWATLAVLDPYKGEE